MSAGGPPIDLSRLSAAEKRQLLARLLAEKAEFQPLSYAQSGMWFLNQLAPDSSAYNAGFAMRILSAANPTSIEQLFQTLVHRHPTLRTTFALRGGQLLQKTHPTTHFSLERIDSAGADEAALREHVHHALGRPFDLEHGPLIRVTLFTRDATDHVLLIVIHHIAFDGWSFWVLLDEFQRLCEAEAIPPLETSYADFVNWERKMLAGPAGAVGSTSAAPSGICGQGSPIRSRPGRRAPSKGSRRRFRNHAIRVSVGCLHGVPVSTQWPGRCDCWFAHNRQEPPGVRRRDRRFREYDRFTRPAS
jgi:hypothetical protein